MIGREEGGHVHVSGEARVCSEEGAVYSINLPSNMSIAKEAQPFRGPFYNPTVALILPQKMV